MHSFVLPCWNNKYSDTTGVVFERAGDGEAADLSFIYSTDSRATQNCAAYQPDHDGIYWGPEFRQRLSLGQGQLTTAFMHELGHVLGLDHFPPGTEPLTIMNQAANCQSPTDVNNVTQSDAQKAASCIATNCPSKPRPVVHPPFGKGVACQDVYQVVDYDYCNAEGCTTVHEWEYVGTVCN